MSAMRNSAMRRMLLGCLRGLIVSVAAGVALVVLVCVLVVVQGQRDEARPAGAAVVLGAAQWNGTPSPVLQARLDHVLDLYKRGYVGRIILAGGAAQGDTVSEAAAGKKYLTDRGLPPESMLLDEQGTTTWESLRNTAALARANGIGAVLLVSDPFHMLRSLKMARDLGLDAYGSPTRTSPISANLSEELRYVVRESWAYLVYLLVRR